MAFAEREESHRCLGRIVQSTSCRQEDLEYGCSLNNLSQEMSPLDEGFRRRTGNLFKDWHDTIALALRRGQKLGLVRSDVDAQRNGYISDRRV